MTNGAPEIELEAYKTAWRELREWLEEEQRTRFAAVDRNTGWIADQFRGSGSMAAHTLTRMEELENSHDLDGDKS